MWTIIGTFVFVGAFIWIYKSFKNRNEFDPIGWVFAVSFSCMAIFFYITQYATAKELSNEYWVTVKVKYCSGGEEELFLTVAGDPKYLHIKNRSRDLAVPELLGLSSNDEPYAYNICSFTIVSSTKLNK